MSKKRSARDTAHEESQAAPGTAVIRVSAEIARQLDIIATVTRKSISEIASPILQAPVEELFKKAVKDLSDEVRP